MGRNDDEYGKGTDFVIYASIIILGIIFASDEAGESRAIGILLILIGITGLLYLLGRWINIRAARQRHPSSGETPDE